jgi:hypothetical protein
VSGWRNVHPPIANAVMEHDMEKATVEANFLLKKEST